MSELDGEYVYLFRDENGNVMYVGRGRSASRFLSHVGKHAHNAALSNKIASRDYTIEISGPFGEQKISAAVEAALISCLKNTPSAVGHLSNQIEGNHLGTFRPNGAPLRFADRPSEPALNVDDLRKAVDGAPILVVYVGEKKFDGRESIKLADLPSDADVLERSIRWWQLDSKMPAWRRDPGSVPALLLSVTGSPAHRVVVASLKIDRDRGRLPWVKSEQGRLSQVPVLDTPDLDFGGFRARRLVADERLKFNAIKAEQFRIV